MPKRTEKSKTVSKEPPLGQTLAVCLVEYRDKSFYSQFSYIFEAIKQSIYAHQKEMHGMR